MAVFAILLHIVLIPVAPVRLAILANYANFLRTCAVTTLACRTKFVVPTKGVTTAGLVLSPSFVKITRVGTVALAESCLPIMCAVAPMGSEGLIARCQMTASAGSTTAKRRKEMAGVIRSATLLSVILMGTSVRLAATRG